MEVVQNSLSLFLPPPVDNSIEKEYWIEFNPVAAIKETGVIEFNIPGTSKDYIDLSKSKLNITYCITDEEGNPIKDERTNGQPNVDSDQVGPVNFTLHSIFRQVDIAFNQRIVSPDVGVNYPYKALIDILLNESSDMIDSQGEAALFYKDTAGVMEGNTYTSTNTAFLERATPTKDGGSAVLEGILYQDLCLGQKRCILNGVAINIKLFQSINDFRLMTSLEKKYKLKITDAIFKVCHVSVEPSMIVAHDEALQVSPALYPFWRSDVKSYNVPMGSHTFNSDNIYHGNVPSKIIIGMVDNAAYSGSYNTNPFNFQNMDVNYLEITVDGQPVPSRPFRPNYLENDYTSSYLSLLDSDFDQKKGIIISKSDYPKGYALYLFDVQSYLSGKVMSKSIKGHVRLSVKFGSSLPMTITILVYSKFPEVMRIDNTRKVDLAID